MNTSDQNKSLAYPGRGTLNRLYYKLPLVLWRMGFGSYFSSPARGGGKMVAITTTGRKSNQPRHTMASCISSGGKDYVISGWGERSDWVKNILADPLVTVQTGGRSYTAHAYRVVEPGEFASAAGSLYDSGGDSHFEEWLETLGVEHSLAGILSRKDQIYLVGFEPAELEGPPPLKADLAWIWVVLILLVAGIFLGSIWP